MTRIAFLDVDGTILEHGDAIAPSTVTAIRTARENGHLVYLCTGRAAGDIHPKVREIGYDGAITNGGAYAARGDELIFADPMPREDTDRLISYFEAEDIDYFLQSDEAVYASPGVGAMVDEFFEHRRRQHLEDARRLGLSEPVDPKPVISYRPLAEANLDQIAKTTFISKRSDSVDRAQADLGDRFHVIPGSIPLPGGSNGEIGLRGTTKGSAIVRVLDVLGLDAADAIGIGDSWNDAEMFDVVGSPVAMGNADPALKERAGGNVTTDVLDDGVWNAFVKLGLV
ncbi:Cof subfamily protein (haloacid dehalogenase superfamily) [Microbacterium marinum]|uniref:Cof subfamily protein (Haloacid dehalogenase superfamily) n=1 Tax=Microbacterium marinum TaxID=421115 RepID=A0A7W7BNN4_9MICO|nr:Cof-type HAD-IIB family hydrolase [Microbacterium marinum]MBB4666002.1 Cof subfamily protein (haloacid dehalogenase superfamily) [Microbacterium marinum]